MNAGQWVSNIVFNPWNVGYEAFSDSDGIMNKYENNWYGNLKNWLNPASWFSGKSGKSSNGASSKDLGKWFKANYGSQFTDDNIQKYLSSIDDATLGDIISKYYDLSGDHIYGKQYSLNLDSLLSDLGKMSEVKATPKLSDYLGDYYGDAEKAIAAENEDILKMYDTNLNRQTDAYKAEMNNLNNSYNDYARQVLGANYQNNAALLGTYQSEMSKARQNALEAGANAGLRIAGNINTLLSAQNKQASTSLETSNQLAQAMLNQRNAAAGIRGNYNNMLSEDTANRANLRRGTYERTMSAANQNYENRMNQYNVANQIANEKNGNYTLNNFYDSYTNSRKANNY